MQGCTALQLFQTLNASCANTDSTDTLSPTPRLCFSVLGALAFDMLDQSTIGEAWKQVTLTHQSIFQLMSADKILLVIKLVSTKV